MSIVVPRQCRGTTILEFHISADSWRIAGVLQISFPLAVLPATVYEDVVLTTTVELAGTRLTATKWKRLHKAPAPALGSNVTVFSVDHTTAGMLMGQVRDPTTWTILQHDGPNRLGL